MLLLNLSRETSLPASVRLYLDTEAGHRAREAYKCRTREPWYRVPDVRTPDYFMSYMSGLEPALVRNDAGCTCTNSLHSVQFRHAEAALEVERQWESQFVQLSCELEGHPLGGGMLKLEPREAARILIPDPRALAEVQSSQIASGVTTMREWRHYGAN